MNRSRAVARLGLACLALLLPVRPGFTEPVHIDNHAPAAGPARLALEELWRIGGAADEEARGLFFGAVTETVADPAGNVYVLDTQMMHVVVVSPEGAIVDTLGREGEGPGGGAAATRRGLPA